MYENLIKRLREYPDIEENASGYVEIDWQDLLDAADTIESLTGQLSAIQSENAEKDKEIERLRKELTQAHTIETLTNYNQNILRYKIKRAEAERDAAVKLIPHICANCILKDGPCKIRDEGGIRYGAYTCGVFEWRGAQREA